MKKTAVALVIGLTLGAGVTAQAGARFTPAVQDLLQQHTCPEDNVRAVTAARPNPRFDGIDRLRVVCMSREHDSWANAR